MIQRIVNLSYCHTLQSQPVAILIRSLHIFRCSDQLVLCIHRFSPVVRVISLESDILNAGLFDPTVVVGEVQSETVYGGE